MSDRLIILFGEILKKTYNLSKDFIGNVGGDDFLVIQSNLHEDNICSLTKKAQRKFAESALSYYTEEHRNNLSGNNYPR